MKIEDSKVLGVFIKSLGFDHRKLKVDDFVLSIVAMNDREFENFVFKEYNDFKENPVQSFKNQKNIIRGYNEKTYFKFKERVF